MATTNLIQAENDLLKHESEVLREKLALYEEKERQEQANLADAALHAQQAREAAIAEHDADERRKFAELSIPRPETLKSYSALSYAVKAKLIENFGSDFPREVAAKERAQMDWLSWDKLNHPERIVPEDTPKKWTAPTDYVDPNGTVMHYSDAHRRWFPGPSPKKVSQ